MILWSTLRANAPLFIAAGLAGLAIALARRAPSTPATPAAKGVALDASAPPDVLIDYGRVAPSRPTSPPEIGIGICRRDRCPLYATPDRLAPVGLLGAGARVSVVEDGPAVLRVVSQGRAYYVDRALFDVDRTVM